jgi:hypothetical protein
MSVCVSGDFQNMSLMSGEYAIKPRWINIFFTLFFPLLRLLFDSEDGGMLFQYRRLTFSGPEGVIP